MPERAHVFVVRDGMILVLEQSSGRRWWELPGGELEPGESPAEAAIREAFEETGLRIESPELLRAWSYANTRGQQITCHSHAALVREGDVRLSSEHTDYAWMPVAAYAERYCGEKLGEAAPEYAAFLAEMRTNCERAQQWVERINAHSEGTTE